MSIMTLLAGEIFGKATEKAAASLFHKTSKVNNFVDFESIIDKFKTEDQINLQDLNLSEEQKEKALDLVHTALLQDLDQFEIEIEGQKFMIDTESLDLKPIV